MFGWVVALVLCLGIRTALGDREATQRKVESVLVPVLEFRQADFAEVVERLQTQARAADPDGEGVNIIAAVPADAFVPPLTMSLRRVSLLEALRYITEVAGLRFRIDDHAVVITTPEQETTRQRIITRVYPVQPAFLSVIEAALGKEEPEPKERWPW